MIRCLLTIAAAGLAVIPLIAADQTTNQPSSPTSAQVTKLVRQLGDTSFQIRTGAMKTLQNMGPDALPPLRLALKQAADPEVRRQLEELLPNMERAAALAPTRISLDMKDKPIRDVIKEFAKQSGYKMEMWPP